MEKLRTPIIFVLIVAILAGGVIFILRQNTSSGSLEILLPTPSEEIKIHVSGEVHSPGIYFLEDMGRVADAIEAAGGFTSDADQSAVNLARTLRDGAQVHVLKSGETSQLINLNTAEAWLLDALPGIGETTAQRIIEHRTEIGPFESIDDLKKVTGIGESTFEKIEDKITVY